MNYREKMKEYLKEPDEHSSQWGRWGILNKEQRDLIKRLLNEMDNADDVIKHQYFEIERLNKQIEEYQKALDETVSEKVDLHSIINKIRNYVYKPIDKEWGDILCIIEDGLRGSDKE